MTRAAFGPGGLRAVVNLVGGYAAGAPLHETALEDFEKMFRLNLRPTFLVTRAAVPFMLDKGGGSIVCVSARAAVQPFGGAVGYVSSKAAVLAFAQAVAADYRDQGVRCNAVLPSVVDTPANRAAQPDADHSRWVAPAEIAGVIRFLCSDESGAGQRRRRAGLRTRLTRAGAPARSVPQVHGRSRVSSSSPCGAAVAGASRTDPARCLSQCRFLRSSSSSDLLA